ncbi:MAG: MFS transporter [Oscillatoriales cyanobacterium RM2_1_1]|nr:MFS transporter [Oscillatoriales cyanobacterium RM2_1_1]
MFLKDLDTLQILHPIAQLAQVLIEPAQPVEPIAEIAEDAAMVFSGPQFFTALVSGVILAFGFQLVMTNLGVAIGISMLGGSSDGRHSKSSNSTNSDSSGNPIKKISNIVGWGTLISVTVALFFASLFAVKLSLLVAPFSGAIVGLVIWATYFSLMVWFSSTTAGSLIGSVVNSATSSFQAIFGTAMATLGSQAASHQVVATAEAAASAVRRELTGVADPQAMREKVEDYINAFRPGQLEIEPIRAEFERIVNSSNVQEMVAQGDLPQLDHQTFVGLLRDRTDLSKRDADRIARTLEETWQNATQQLPQSNSLSQLTDWIQSSPKQDLLGQPLGDKIDGLLDEMRKRRHSQSQGPVKQSLTMGFNSLVGLVMGRTDLSDFDVEKIISQLQQLKDQAVDQKDKVVAQFGEQRDNTIRTDIQNYLLNAYPWQLQDSIVESEFRNLLYDPSADPELVAEQLEQIHRIDFVNWLQEKGMLRQEKIHHLAGILEGICLEVLATAEAASERERAIALFAEVEDYLLNTPRPQLTPERIQLDFKPILRDPDASDEQFETRLRPLDRPTFERVLEQRQDRLSATEIVALVNQLETARDQVLEESSKLFAAAQNHTEAQWLKIKALLRHTGKAELNPAGIERELKLLLDDPQAGRAALKARAKRFDRETLVQLLNQRQDLNESQIREVLDQVEQTWTRVRYQPQRLSQKAQQQYEQSKVAIADYLRNTGKPELNPEGIRRDLTKLIEDPKAGAKALSRRLAEFDQDTIVQLLAQRDDLTEAQIHQTAHDVQATLRDLARSPQRLARRAQANIRNFQESIADYLRSTEKAELNPTGIKRDVQLLLNSPQAGAESLQDRLSQFDRSTLVALLSQRDDISEAEVNRIIDQMLEVRDQAVHQLRQIQSQIQSAIDRMLDRIRRYLNSLDRPELNYEAVRNDFQTLFDDPQAGFEALRDRLSQFDRNTFVALLSSRDDISEADANRLIDQAERARTRVLQKTERLQQGAQLRLEQVRREAERSVEETRKAAATAAWWLFFTALISAIAAAGAGAIGVTV